MPTSVMNPVPPAQDAMIGAGRMGMGADDQARLAVDEMAERPFLARRFGVEVDDRGVARLAERASAKLALDGGERIVERVHEDAAHHVDDEEPRARPALDQRRAPSRRARGEIDRADQARLALDEHERLALIEGVIAERHRVDAGGEEVLENRFGEAEAARGVLAVDDDEIELPAVAQKGNLLEERGAPGPPDDVADEQETDHCSLKRMVSCSVTTASRLWSWAS